MHILHTVKSMWTTKHHSCSDDYNILPNVTGHPSKSMNPVHKAKSWMSKFGVEEPDRIAQKPVLNTRIRVIQAFSSNMIV